MGRKERTTVAVPSHYIVIDVETTGLSAEWCEVIEVAAIEVDNYRIIDTYESLVRPSDLPIDPFIEELTGITTEMLEDAPDPSIPFGDLIDWFRSGLPIVGHNICFDMRFIESAYRGFGIDIDQQQLVDTMRLSRYVLPDLPKRRLEDLVDALGVDLRPEHRAMADVSATVACFEAMRSMVVDLFGSDVEAGFAKWRKRRGHSKKPIGDYAPTVDEIDESNPFFGAEVCFTGALSGMTRDEAHQHAVNLGAKPRTGVTKNLDYLIVGSLDFRNTVSGDKSSKIIKAEKQLAKAGNPQIMDESFFLSFCREG